MNSLRKILEILVQENPELANDIYFTLDDIFLNKNEEISTKIESGCDPDGWLS